MRKIGEYWASVRRMADSLPDGDIWLVSTEDSSTGRVGGVLVQAPRAAAAKAIVDRTHRPATEIEISRYLESEALRRTADYQAEMARQGRTVLFVESPAQRNS
jgi:hypothetical protein